MEHLSCLFCNSAVQPLEEKDFTYFLLDFDRRTQNRNDDDLMSIMVHYF